jgi:hypothetical protein
MRKQEEKLLSLMSFWCLFFWVLCDSERRNQINEETSLEIIFFPLKRKQPLPPYYLLYGQ